MRRIFEEMGGTPLKKFSAGVELKELLARPHGACLGVRSQAMGLTSTGQEVTMLNVPTYR